MNEIEIIERKITLKKQALKFLTDDVEDIQRGLNQLDLRRSLLIEKVRLERLIDGDGFSKELSSRLDCVMDLLK